MSERVGIASGLQVTFDCAEPSRMARFWASVLGYRLEDPPNGHASWHEWARAMKIPEDQWDDGASIVDPGGRRPRLYFQRVPEKKAVKNRVHLDLDVSDGRGAPLEQRRRQVEDAASRIESLGGRRLMTVEEHDHYHVTMQDPEGNELCLR